MIGNHHEAGDVSPAEQMCWSDCDTAAEWIANSLAKACDRAGMTKNNTVIAAMIVAPVCQRQAGVAPATTAGAGNPAAKKNLGVYRWGTWVGRYWG